MRNWLVLALALACAQALGAVETTFDRFNGTTTIKYVNPPESRWPSLSAFSSFQGQSPAGKRKNQLIFSVKLKDWKYSSCHQIAFLVDGKPLQIGQTKHDGRVSDGYVYEMISLTPTTAAMKKLGAANKVEYKICNDEYELTEDDIAAIKSLVAEAK